MAKRIIIFTLTFALVCGALFVSCTPEPSSDSKVLGHWMATYYIEDAPYADEYNVELTFYENRTFKGTVDSEMTYDCKFSGTWVAVSRTNGMITVTGIEKENWKKALDFGIENRFYTDEDDYLIIYGEHDSDAVCFHRYVTD